jgi:hypothetical protein
LPDAGGVLQWFDDIVMPFVKDREAKFYELMTAAFRSEMHQQVRWCHGLLR